MTQELAKYQTEDGADIVLTSQNVRDIISTSPNVTDKEIMLFAALCKANKLNPFIREAHLIKYGTNPATMVISKDVFLKRAVRNPRFQGYEAGITIVNRNGEIERRKGSLVGANTERLVGGWCSVYLKDYQTPMYDEVSLEEYMGRKKDGTPNNQWKTKPATMIRKVAIVHALREAFPEDLSGLYEQSEMGLTDEAVEQINGEPIETEQEYIEVTEEF